MKLQELKNYLKNKYALHFEVLTTSQDKFFVLKAPGNPNYFVQFKPENELQVDINCGSFSEIIRDLPEFSFPYYTHDNNWVGVNLENANFEAVAKAVDYAYKLALNKNHTGSGQYIVLNHSESETDTDKYQAQTIPFNHDKKPVEVKNHLKDNIPEPIHKMLQAYDYSILPRIGRERNFYKQAQIVANYEDDYSKFYPFKRYYPVYHDMTINQLRTYFAWRSKVRKGVYQETSSSYVFVYIYELLNQVGVKDSLEGYHQLKELEKNYISTYAPFMAVYLKRWLQDYVVFYQLPAEVIEQEFKKEIKQDTLYERLLNPADAEELMQVIRKMATYHGKSPLKEEFNQVFFYAWKEALTTVPDFFDNTVAMKVTEDYFPFTGAIFYNQNKKSIKLEIDKLLKFKLNEISGSKTFYLPQARRKILLNKVLHEVDRISRDVFQVGRKLKANDLSDVVVDAIRAGIKKYQLAKIEASKPKIEIDFSDLDQIRRDASQTRESLLTEEEKQDSELGDNLNSFDESTFNQEVLSANDGNQEVVQESYGLNEDEVFFLKALLNHRPFEDYLNKKHLMVSILADSINEKIIDEIGDSVIEFDENDTPKIVEDYREDLMEMF
ncbi:MULTISPECIES: TerB N-terminal domain-containing protein [unclassified Lactobacillus]|uniref:TerB N-terminal domain-containing protein n=1 Tax=unclassified Lactobacillus TaxID=2620435 RepID=UPI0022401493|nr:MULTISPECIES: TerB N-terminal domain-containing protein [unclassified Lactobacillus]